MSGDRLLIIDDDEAVLEHFALLSRGCGYEVRETSQPAVFLDHVAAWQPTHILLDLQMPLMDGIELLRSLGSRRVRAKIIIVSGYDGRVIEAARRIGMERGLQIVATLLKPTRNAEFRELLARLATEEGWCTAPALAAAMDDRQLFLEYQPKVDLANGEVIGFEALVRWRHPRQGTVYPGQFIALAEGAGLIDRLTDTIVEIGFEQAEAWGARGRSLALNLSSRSLYDLTFADRLLDRCRERHVDPGRLVLELTESSAMEDPLRAMDILTRLRLKGFHLSMDDFGTGFSSLVQLARLPFSELKIDKTFIIDSGVSPEARAIIKSTIYLAHNLGLRAVAEGVETADAMRLIAEFGCDLAQGYHIGKPLPVGQIDAWLATWEGRRTSAASTFRAPAEPPPSEPLSPWTKSFDGSDEMRAALVQALVVRINPLWGLGRNSLIAWRPTHDGIEVLMVPFQNIVDRFAESQRLMHGRRLMGDRTFRQALDLAGVVPIQIRLPFRIRDDEAGAVPTEEVEQVLRHYGITETQHRAVALFDIVSFSRGEPKFQVAQLNSLECSINTAHDIMRELGKPIDLARTTTGDGFYIWNREKGAKADHETYLLTLLVLADNAIARRDGRRDMVPEIRTCFSVGPHYSYHQVDGLDPKGHDYIVGDVTIGLARMIAKCLPGQILIGDFSRPVDHDAEPGNPLEFVVQADGAFARFHDVRLHGRSVRGIKCYLTGEARDAASFDVTRFRIRDKHGLDHHVFNQKFNVYLSDAPEAAAQADALFLGKQQAELSDFDAERASPLAE